MNRKASFKMAYKARSFKIQDVLTKLNATFTANLIEATEKEDKSLSDYNRLKGAKTGELSEAQTAPTSTSSENGATGMSLTDAQTEVLQTRSSVSCLFG